MPVSIDVLDATKPLSDLQTVIQQTEELGYRLLSFCIGWVGGAQASLVTFSQGTATGAPANPVTLGVVVSSLNKDQQEAQLNTRGKPVICYGSLYVEGQAQNVAAYR